MTNSNKIKHPFYAVVASFFLWCIAALSFAEEARQPSGLFDAIVPLSINLGYAEYLDEEQGPDAAYRYLSSLTPLASFSKERLTMARAAYAARAGHIKHAEHLYLELIHSTSYVEAQYTGYFNLSEMLLHQTNRTVEAGLYLEKAAELAPEHPLILAYFGSALYRQGNLQKALEVTSKAVRLMETSPRSQKMLNTLRPLIDNRDSEKWGQIEILARYGELLWESGSEEKSSKIWCDALRLDLNNQSRNATLSEILSRHEMKNKLACL